MNTVNENDDIELTCVCEICGKELPLRAFGDKRILFIKWKKDTWCKECRRAQKEKIFLRTHATS